MVSLRWQFQVAKDMFGGLINQVVVIALGVTESLAKHGVIDGKVGDEDSRGDIGHSD